MSGGNWEYLSHTLEERIGAPLDDVWKLLAGIEHALDWGICCDTCYDCAKIRTIAALEAYFDTGATSVELSLRLLRSLEPECATCKDLVKKDAKPWVVPSQESPARGVATIEYWDASSRKIYKGTVYEVAGGEG